MLRAIYTKHGLIFLDSSKISAMLSTWAYSAPTPMYTLGSNQVTYVTTPTIGTAITGQITGSGAWSTCTSNNTAYTWNNSWGHVPGSWSSNSIYTGSTTTTTSTSYPVAVDQYREVYRGHGLAIQDNDLYVYENTGNEISWFQPDNHRYNFGTKHMATGVKPVGKQFRNALSGMITNFILPLEGVGFASRKRK